MPPDYRHYKVLDEVILSSEKERAKGIYKAVQMVKPVDGSVEIRVCYYTKRKRNDGSEWWGLSPRPPHFSPDEARDVAQGIIRLVDKYELISNALSI